jgi:DNA-binding MarR family transcriptional regulator
VNRSTAARPGADQFLTAFDGLAQAVRRARGATATIRGREQGLTLSQYALVRGLAERERARIRELASEAGVTPSTATRILDALERRGIVERTHSDEDRRAITITLTDPGRRLLTGQDAWLRARQRSFYATLPPAERELAPDLLIRLAALIDELAGGPEG